MTNPIERVFVAVDVNNLWHVCRNTYGQEYRVSYGALRRLIEHQEENKLKDIKLIAYTVALPYRRDEDETEDEVSKPAIKNAKFLQSLERFGYIVKTRQMIIDKASQKAFGTNWDVGITIDAIKNADDFDTFVLVSGDGDYSILLEELRHLGKRVEVVAFKNSASKLLHSASNKVTYISEMEIFCDSRISEYKESNSENSSDEKTSQADPC